MVRSMVVLAVLALAVPARAVQLQVSSAVVARPGDVAEVCVSMQTGGEEVAGVQADLVWDGACATLDSAGSCRIEPATGKQLFARVLPSRDFALRTVVVSLADVDPISDGRLYCCDFQIEAPPQSCCTIGLDRFGAADPLGNEIGVVSGSSGRECVESAGIPFATATPTFTPTPRSSPAGGGGDETSSTADSAGCQIAGPSRPAAWPSLLIAAALLLLRRRR